MCAYVCVREIRKVNFSFGNDEISIDCEFNVLGKSAFFRSIKMRSGKEIKWRIATEMFGSWFPITFSF